VRRTELAETEAGLRANIKEETILSVTDLADPEEEIEIADLHQDSTETHLPESNRWTT